MLDIAVAYDRYRFLGYEFLTWLWYLTEKDPDRFQKLDPDLAAFDMGNRVVLENMTEDAPQESITIKGDDAGLEEGMLALLKGAVVTEMNMIYKSGDHEWRFNLKGESLNISGLKTPETAPVESEDDMDGAVLEKVYLYEKVLSLIDALYGDFIRLRISDNWANEAAPKISAWIKTPANGRG